MTTTMTARDTATLVRIDPAIARSFLSRCTIRSPLATADPAEDRVDLAAVDDSGHPSWCTSAGLSDWTTCGGRHISDTTDVPALGGPWTLTDGGGDIARA
ncbi:hypothetical protein GCM10009558_000270 [Virgisporangium aurantiacum]